MRTPTKGKPLSQNEGTAQPYDFSAELWRALLLVGAVAFHVLYWFGNFG